MAFFMLVLVLVGVGFFITYAFKQRSKRKDLQAATDLRKDVALRKQTQSEIDKLNTEINEIKESK